MQFLNTPSDICGSRQRTIGERPITSSWLGSSASLVLLLLSSPLQVINNLQSHDSASSVTPAPSQTGKLTVRGDHASHSFTGTGRTWG